MGQGKEGWAWGLLWGSCRGIGPGGCENIGKYLVHTWLDFNKKLQKYTPSALADQLVTSATSGSSCGDLAGTEETWVVNVNCLYIILEKLLLSQLKIIMMQKIRRCYIYPIRVSDADWMDRCQTT